LGKVAERYDVSILVAEDDQDILLLLTSYLARRATKVYGAPDGQEAIAIFDSNHIDIVVTDIAMPRINGLELTKMIRGRNEDIPIIIASGYYEKDMLLEAIDLNITSFISKPIDNMRLTKALNKCYALIEQKRLKKEIEAKNIELESANSYIQQAYAELKKAKETEVELLEYKNKYHTWQEENAFRKQIQLIKDELCRSFENGLFFSNVYEPRDILSGDSYGTCRLDDGKYFLYLFDAMGKGLSASMTSTILSSHLNRYLDEKKEFGRYDFETLLEDFIKFTKKQLLRDEILGVFFVELDKNIEEIRYAGFGMPPIIVQDEEGKVFEIDSNNPPLRISSKEPLISKRSIKGLKKLLIYSDALMESPLKEGGIYFERLKEDVRESICAATLHSLFKKRVGESKDDITMIFIYFYDMESAVADSFYSRSDFEEIDRCMDRVKGFAKEKLPLKKFMFFETALQEIVLNALEHGNIGINSDYKNRLLYAREYESYLKERMGEEDIYNKKIEFELFFSESEEESIIGVAVGDEGVGFDICKTFKEITVRNSVHLGGRGLKVSELYTNGIYFNRSGNKAVLFLTTKEEDEY